MKMRTLKVSTPKPAPEPALNQQQIVQVALALLDEVGFDGLTMRALAQKLDIKAASIYWHVRSKQELWSLLADEICAPMREPDRTLPWREQLEALGQEYRRVLLAHRDAARVLSSSAGPSGPHRLRLSEIVLRTLLDAGFGKQDTAYAGSLMNDYVTMFVLEETQNTNAEETTTEDAAPNWQNWVEALPPNEYPSIIAVAPYLADPNVNARFQFGIEIIRSGLEARLAASR